MYSRRRDSETPAWLRLTVSLAVGVLVGIAAGLLMSGVLAPLIGWDAAAATYVGWHGVSLMTRNPAETAARAKRDDPGRAVTDVIILIAAVASLGAVAVVLVRASGSQGAAQVGYAALAILSIVLSWAVLHITYALRYARLYYTDPVGGIDFNDDTEPKFTDFAYLAFTIGMTFQVSDTSLRSSTLRSAALRHSLLSYLFGTVIIAATINLVSGLSH